MDDPQPRPLSPLLRLPSIAWDLIVKCMDPLELLLLSQTSKKSRATVIRLTKKWHFHMTICACRNDHSVLIECGDRKSQLFNFNRQIGQIATCRFKLQNGTEVPWCLGYNEMDQRMISYWDNFFDGFKLICQFLRDIFNVTTISFTFEHQPDFKITRLFMVMRTTRLKYRKIRLAGENVPKTVLSDILMQASEASELELSGSNFEGPRHDGHLRYLHLDSLKIDNSTWITKEYLLVILNCRRVEMRGSTLRSRALNFVLRKWKTMDRSRVEYLSIETTGNLNLMRIRNGLEGEDMNGVEWEHLELLEPLSIYSIQRGENGIRAMIYCWTRRIVLRTFH